MTLKKIVSFGHRYGLPVIGPGILVVDVRRMFSNPFLRLQQADTSVEKELTKAADFQAKYTYLKEVVSVPGTEIAYIGCYGGLHRSVFLAERLGQELGVAVEHRDKDR